MAPAIPFIITTWNREQNSQRTEHARLHSPVLTADTGNYFLPILPQDIYQKRLALVEFLDHREGKPLALIWIERGYFEDPIMTGQDMPYWYPLGNLSPRLKTRVDEAAKEFNTPSVWLTAALQARFPQSLLSVTWVNSSTTPVFRITVTQINGGVQTRELTEAELNSGDLLQTVKDIARGFETKG